MSTEISSYDAFWGCAGGLRVASTFRLPHLLHRSRFTKPTIGVAGVIARRNNAASVNTPDSMAAGSGEPQWSFRDDGRSD
jgi:hypothetical protein